MRRLQCHRAVTQFLASVSVVTCSVAYDVISAIPATMTFHTVSHVTVMLMEPSDVEMTYVHVIWKLAHVPAR